MYGIFEGSTKCCRIFDWRNVKQITQLLFGVFEWITYRLDLLNMIADMTHYLSTFKHLNSLVIECMISNEQNFSTEANDNSCNSVPFNSTIFCLALTVDSLSSTTSTNMILMISCVYSVMFHYLISNASQRL